MSVVISDGGLLSRSGFWGGYDGYGYGGYGDYGGYGGYGGVSHTTSYTVPPPVRTIRT